jgi:hypothetical protein
MPKSIVHHPSKPLLSSGNGLFIAIFLLTMVHKTETKSRIRFYTWSCLSAIKGRLIKASLKKVTRTYSQLNQLSNDTLLNNVEHELLEPAKL